MQLGDNLTHKASGKVMVVIALNLDYPRSVKCRFYNPRTGLYECAEFEKVEFKEYPEIGDWPTIKIEEGDDISKSYSI